MPHDVCIDVRSCGAEHRPIRRHHTPDELFRVVEAREDPGDFRMGAQCPIFSATVFPL